MLAKERVRASLQNYLGKKQHELWGKGILFPHNIDKLQKSTAPKHQWFEKNLVTTHVEFLLENTHTILVSSEGIDNYWWDFPDASKDILRELGKLSDGDVVQEVIEKLGQATPHYNPAQDSINV